MAAIAEIRIGLHGAREIGRRPLALFLLDRGPETAVELAEFAGAAIVAQRFRIIPRPADRSIEGNRRVLTSQRIVERASLYIEPARLVRIRGHALPRFVTMAEIGAGERPAALACLDQYRRA